MSIRNVSAEQYAKVVELRAQGLGLKAIQQATGLSHSPVECVLMHHAYFEVAGAEAIEPTEENVVALRDYYQISWGAIGIMCNTTESRVRSLYKKATNTESVGTRIGKGGRYFAGDPDLYADQLKVSGTKIPAGEIANRKVHAEVQRVMKLSFEELKATAEDWGVEVPKRTTKAALAKKVAKAILASAEEA